MKQLDFERLADLDEKLSRSPVLFGFRGQDGELYFYTRSSNRPAPGDTLWCRVAEIGEVEGEVRWRLVGK